MKFLKISFLILLFPIMTASTAHKFYVSTTKIEYVKERQVLQIISKIFIDDIEAVLQQRYDPTIELATTKETEQDVETLIEYVMKKIAIEVNNIPVTINYIGREYKMDIVNIYMEVEGISELKKLEVTNKLLIEVFEEQQNIIHFKSKKNRKSLILDKDNPTGMLNFN